jgi:hypothetical protein
VAALDGGAADSHAHTVHHFPTIGQWQMDFLWHYSPTSENKRLI